MSSRGFTLLEVLVATLLFGISILAIVQSNTSSLRKVRQSENLFKATQLAQAKMVEEELKFQKTVNQGISTGTFTNEAGTFDKPYENFSWKAELRETTLQISAQNVTSVLQGLGLESDDVENQVDQMRLLLTNMNKFIKENMAELYVVVQWEEFGRKQTLPLLTQLTKDGPKNFTPTTTAE
jgi:prepilin-type N-terminal cleavage/methylation domain-containing protein